MRPPSHCEQVPDAVQDKIMQIVLDDSDGVYQFFLHSNSNRDCPQTMGNF